MNNYVMENPNCGFLLFYITNISKIAMGLIYLQIIGVNILICHKDIYYS